MFSFRYSDLGFFIPEIAVLIVTLLFQLYALFNSAGDNNAATSPKNIIKAYSFSLLLIILYLFINTQPLGYGFGTSYNMISELLIAKKAIFIFLLLSSLYYSISQTKLQFEYITIMAIASIASSVTIAANNFIVLFMCLELQSLCAYILTAIKRDSYEACEAGLKYFIIGSLFSCIFGLGISFLYGFGGNLSYETISYASSSLGYVIGSALVIITLCFKLAASPFHWWITDVYQASLSPTVMFFSTVTKIAALTALWHIILESGDDIVISNIITVISIISMLVGAIGGLKQTNIKRLLAYSAINNIGYILIAFATSTAIPGEAVENYKIAITYLIIYGVTVVGVLWILYNMLGEKLEDASLEDLAINSKEKITYILLPVFIFSLIGLPPFAGFFVKYSIFVNALESEKYLLLTVAVISTVIAAVYYLKILKYLYFHQKKTFVKQASESTIFNRFVIFLLGIIILCFSIYKPIL